MKKRDLSLIGCYDFSPIGILFLHSTERCKSVFANFLSTLFKISDVLYF